MSEGVPRQSPEHGPKALSAELDRRNIHNSLAEWLRGLDAKTQADIDSYVFSSDAAVADLGYITDEGALAELRSGLETFLNQVDTSRQSVASDPMELVRAGQSLARVIKAKADEAE